jgi:hypothetical protein
VWVCFFVSSGSFFSFNFQVLSVFIKPS